MPALRLSYRGRVSSRQSSDCILHPSRQPCVKLIDTNLITRYNRFTVNSCTSISRFLFYFPPPICLMEGALRSFFTYYTSFQLVHFLLSPSHLHDGGCAAIILHLLHKFQLVHVCHYNFTLHVFCWLSCVIHFFKS